MKAAEVSHQQFLQQLTKRFEGLKRLAESRDCSPVVWEAIDATEKSTEAVTDFIPKLIEQLDELQGIVEQLPAI